MFRKESEAMNIFRKVEHGYISSHGFDEYDMFSNMVNIAIAYLATAIATAVNHGSKNGEPRKSMEKDIANILETLKNDTDDTLKKYYR